MGIDEVPFWPLLAAVGEI